MKKQLIYPLFLLLIMMSTAFAEKWISPTEIKYQKANPGLYEKYVEAREILSAWQGRSEELYSAKKILDAVIQGDMNFAPAYRERGRLFMMEGYIDEYNYKKGSLHLAVLSILKAVKIEPGYEDAYVLLAHVYTNKKQYEDAITALEKAEALGTQSPWLYLNRAELFELQGEYNDALKSYMKIIREGADNEKAFSTALDGVIMCYEKKGDYQKTEKWFRKGIKYEPDNVVRRVNYSIFLLYTLHDVERSIKLSENTLKRWNYDMVHFVLACGLYTKWALMTDQGRDKIETRDILNYAMLAYPDLDQVIQVTSANAYTKITAEKLTMLRKIQKENLTKKDQ